MNELDKIFELKMLVLLEVETGEFRQVILNKSQFKEISDIICSPKKGEEDLKEGFEEVEVQLSDDWKIDADLFLGLSSFNE